MAAANLNDPSVGIDAATGGTLTGWAHVEQSLLDIFLTRFGERIMREWYGSFVMNMLGENITADNFTVFLASITSAIEQWEPRYVPTAARVVNVTRDGKLTFYIEGEYRPRALMGDNRAVGARRLDAVFDGGGFTITQRQ